MANALLSESVLEKTASLAVGCCIAGGILTISTAAAPVVMTAASLSAVLGALGLRQVIRESPECEKVWKTVLKRLPHRFIHAQDADEAAVRAATTRLSNVLNVEGLFRVDSLKAALQLSNDVAEGMTLNALSVVSAADPIFGEEGLHRDLAQALFSAGFEAARDACDEFRSRAGLAVGEAALLVARTSAERLDEVALRQQEILEIIRAGQLSAIERQRLERRIRDLQETQRFTRKLIRALLGKLTNGDVPDKDLLGEFERQIDAIGPLIEEARRPSNIPEVAVARAALDAALTLGDLDAADRAYEQAAITMREVKQVAAREEAEFHAGRARLARAQRRWRDAERLWAVAAEALPPELKDEICTYWVERAIDLQLLGDRFGKLADIESAASLLNQSLKYWTPEVSATHWAMAQNSLGAALRTLGMRTGGQAGLKALNDAVQAYEAALRVRTETSMPADWATTQNNLGSALQTLGVRTGGEAGLKALNDAVQAYEAALRVRTETDMPASWAATQNNLGAALQNLGERAGDEAGRKALNDAVQAYQRALRVYTEADMPADWAATQNNLGTVLQTLGGMTAGEAGLEALDDAIRAYQSALRVRTETDMPTQWAMTQNNLGNALQMLGGIDRGKATPRPLDDAIQAYQAALRVRTQADMPAQWAVTQNNLAKAEQASSALTRDPGPVQSAIARTEQVIPVFAAMGATAWVEIAEDNLARQRALLAELEASS